MGDVTPMRGKSCPYCDDTHDFQRCPRLFAIEYYPDGSLQRVEFMPDPIIEFEFDDDDTPEDE